MYLFTGRELDCLDNGNLLLNYHRARYYDFHRWMTRDPAEYPDGYNLYAGYFGMRGGTDPYGLNTDYATCIKKCEENRRQCFRVALDNLKACEARVLKEADEMLDKLEKEQERQYAATTTYLKQVRDNGVRWCNQEWPNNPIARQICKQGYRRAYNLQKGIAWAAYKAALTALEAEVAAFKTGEFFGCSVAGLLEGKACQKAERECKKRCCELNRGQG